MLYHLKMICLRIDAHYLAAMNTLWTRKPWLVPVPKLILHTKLKWIVIFPPLEPGYTSPISGSRMAEPSSRCAVAHLRQDDKSRLTAKTGELHLRCFWPASPSPLLIPATPDNKTHLPAPTVSRFQCRRLPATCLHRRLIRVNLSSRLFLPLRAALKTEKVCLASKTGLRLLAQTSFKTDSV